MNLDTDNFKRICSQSFTKMDGLYHPTDKIKLRLNTRGLFYGSYESQIFSDKKSIPDPSFDELTRVSFVESSKRFCIIYLSVNKEFRGRGFSKLMSNSVEAIARQRDRTEIFVESVDNPEFWLHQGYSPTTVRIYGRRDLDDPMFEEEYLDVEHYVKDITNIP